jgi:hypothetical protein
MSRYENRRWIFLNSGDMSEVNFDQVLQTSADTCRYSLDGTKAFVKYNLTTHPIQQGIDFEGNAVYNDNVDSEGNTYNFQYEQVGTETGPEGNEIILYSNNIIGSGLAFASGEVVGEPDILDKALTISGKEEFTHQETLEILLGEDWAEPIPQL